MVLAMVMVMVMVMVIVIVIVMVMVMVMVDKVDGVAVEEAYRVDGETRPQDVRVRLAFRSLMLSP